MRALYNDFLVNGTPILVPDRGINMEFNDLDTLDSGRDESGVMHRRVLRHSVPKWSLSYASLTREEYVYMKNLFHGLSTFQWTYLDENTSEPQTCAAYCSNYSITYQDSVSGLYKNFKFNIIAC